MTINLGHTNLNSSAVRDELTHIAAIGRFVVNISVTPKPGEETPVAHLRIHYGDDRRTGYALTTDSPEDLFAASRALQRAAEMLLQDQQAETLRQL